MDANFTSSIGANLVTGIFFVLMWVLKNKCKHSTCDTHSGCIDCHVDDEFSESKENDDEIPLEAKRGLQEV